MNLQALLIRASVSIAAGLAMAAGVALNHSRPVEAFTATPASSVKAHAAIVAEPVTLPTIHVRPTLAQRMAAAQPSAPSGTGMVIQTAFDIDAGVPALDFEPKWVWDCTEPHQKASALDASVEVVERGPPPAWLLKRLREKGIDVRNLPATA